MTFSSHTLETFFASYRPALHHVQTGFWQAAVLVPLIESGSGTHNRFDLLLTKRTDIVEHHKGQISFPGGRADHSDASLMATALREAREEIGLAEDRVRIIGSLDQVWTPSGFLITPFVGIIKDPLPVLEVNPAEVESLMIVPLEKFFDEANFRTEIRIVQGMERTVYFFDVASEPVWGATALIVHRLITLIREFS
ncbi:MAG TPA: CoA pyrophosphatase [Bacteroidota bacterium]|nr:CoA pyrophosphatase [Bacteroidota bacterium]